MTTLKKYTIYIERESGEGWGGGDPTLSLVAVSSVHVSVLSLSSQCELCHCGVRGPRCVFLESQMRGLVRVRNAHNENGRREGPWEAEMTNEGGVHVYTTEEEVTSEKPPPSSHVQGESRGPGLKLLVAV